MNEVYTDDYQEIDLMELIMILWRGKWVIILITLVAVVGTFIASKLIDPVYEATASLRMQRPLYANRYVPTPPSEQEVLEILKFPGVMQAIHEAVELGESWESIENALSIEVPNQTGLLIMKAQAKSPEDAKDLLDAWIDIGTRTFEQRISEVVKSTYEPLAQELEKSKKALDEARHNWTEFSKASQIQALSKRLDSLTSSLVQYERDKRDLLTNIAAEESKLRALTEGLSQQQSNIILKQSLLGSELPADLLLKQAPAVVENELINPVYQDITQKLIDAQATLASLKSRLESIDLLIVETQDQIEQTQTRLATENEMQKRLNMQLDERSNQYRTLLQQYEEARLAASLPLTYFEKIGQPLARKDPIKPRTLLNVAIAGVLGVFVGIGLAFFLEYFEDYKKRQANSETKVLSV